MHFKFMVTTIIDTNKVVKPEQKAILFDWKSQIEWKQEARVVAQTYFSQ